MQQYIAQRVLLMIPTLFGVTLLVLIMMRALPGDIVDLIAGEQGITDEATRAAIVAKLGLGKSLPEAYVSWVGQILRFDLGTSLLSGRSVGAEFARRLPITIELGLLAMFFQIAIGIPIGIISAVRQNTMIDYVGRSFAIGMLAAPNFWIALILIGLAGRYFTPFVPPAAYPAFGADPIANIKFMIVPAFIIGASGSGGIMRFTRTAMLEVLRQDYVRTARAKGLTDRVVITRHALKNALIPVITIIGLGIPGILGGSVIIEIVYSIPGVGRYYFTSLTERDLPIVQAYNLIAAISLVVANLGVDLSYAWLNPRIRYS